MPYTPPASRSPASSVTASPDISRRPSFHLNPNGIRPALPRSSSYLTRHRRTPSAVEIKHAEKVSAAAEAALAEAKAAGNGSIRQSPPPVTSDNIMPAGAIISPPESSSDDDDLPEMRGRQLDNLKELEDAIRQIPTQSAGSPEETEAIAEAVLTASLAEEVALADGMHHSFSTSALDDMDVTRRFSHRRSYTENNLLVPKSAETSVSTSEAESDEENFVKPPMVRKKSGELVRPALRPPSRRRPSSMPGTPTFSKAVHFDSHLEHVRHFLQVDRPLAVSAGSSPVDNYDSDNEYPFPASDAPTVRQPPFEWEIIINNFPVETLARKAMAVRLEKVWLTTDRKCLTGSIAIQNLAFQKNVTCRFTLDYWKTTSEVAAEYSSEILPRVSDTGHDRFNFSIKLSDLANLESKTLFFALRYNVNGQEFWDNNNGTNFQVDFKKKMLPQNGKKGVIGAANRPAQALPRSSRRTPTGTSPRPKSMPVSFNEFGDSAKMDFDQSIHEYMGESKSSSLRLKTTTVPSDNLSSRLSAPSGQAFANRYDFGASLTAAVQAAKDSMSKAESPVFKPRKPTIVVPTSTGKVAGATEAQRKNQAAVNANSTIPAVQKPVAPATIASSSYEELVNKYCFFGSKRGSPQMLDGTLTTGENLVVQPPESNDSSSTASPLVMSHGLSGRGQGLAVSRESNNSYFHSSPLVSASSSPLITPLGSTKKTSQLADQQPRSMSSPLQQEVARTASPVMHDGYLTLTGTPPPHAFAYQQDRFPFTNTDAHATPIRS